MRVPSARPDEPDTPPEVRQSGSGGWEISRPDGSTVYVHTCSARRPSNALIAQLLTAIAKVEETAHQVRPDRPVAGSATTLIP